MSGRASSCSRSTLARIRRTWPGPRRSWSGRRPTAALAGREVERAQRLVAVQAISREEFDTRTSAHASEDAGVRAAEAAVATARLNLEWTEVRSPISGRVSRAEVTAGNLVQAGPPDATLLTTVVSLDPIYVYFESDEQTYLKYTALARDGSRPNSRDNRSPVELGLANEEGFPHRGLHRLRRQSAQPRGGHHPASRRLRQQEPRVHAGPLRPDPAGGEREVPGHSWSSTAPSAPTRTRSSCWSSSRIAPWTTARCSSAG